MPLRSVAGTSGAAQGGLAKLSSAGVDAEPVFSCVFDEGLGVDRSAEVDVEIGALGELVEEGVQRKRAAFDGDFIGAGGTQLFRRLPVKGGGRKGEPGKASK